MWNDLLARITDVKVREKIREEVRGLIAAREERDEAWKERDRANRRAAQLVGDCDSLRHQLGTAKDERDGAQTSLGLMADRLAATEKERDEAREKLETVRAELETARAVASLRKGVEDRIKAIEKERDEARKELTYAKAERDEARAWANTTGTGAHGARFTKLNKVTEVSIVADGQRMVYAPPVPMHADCLRLFSQGSAIYSWYFNRGALQEDVTPKAKAKRDYRVLLGSSPETLQDEVLSYLDAGWRPCGGVAAAPNGRLLQAMVRRL